MKYQNFPVFQEENGILTEVEIDEKNTQLYVMKQYCESPYVGFPIPENGINIYHCVTGFNSWSHRIVLSQKTKDEEYYIGLSDGYRYDLTQIEPVRITEERVLE